MGKGFLFFGGGRSPAEGRTRRKEGGGERLIRYVAINIRVACECGAMLW